MNRHKRMEAISSLVPDAGFRYDNTGITNWYSSSGQPTEAEIDAEVIKLQAVYDSQEYARSRAAEYPSIADQLDDIYHNGIDAWKATIKTTKDKYPKE